MKWFKKIKSYFFPRIVWHPTQIGRFSDVGFRALANTVADTSDIKYSTVVQHAEQTQQYDQWQAGSNIGQPRGL